MTTLQATKLHTIKGHLGPVYALQSGKDPHLFFSGSGDGMVVLWDLNDPEKGQLIARMPGPIYALLYLKENDLLVVGNNFEGIHLIDWKEKKELRSLKLNASEIFDIQSYGNDIFIASGDGIVTVVDLERWKVSRKIGASEKSARTIAINPIRGEAAVGYSDNSIRVFSLPEWTLKHEWVAHLNSVFTLAYSPDFKTLLSGSRDARLKVWDAENAYSQAAEVVAHLYAINNIAFSPDGKHFVTCSLDKSIKVWDAGEPKLLKVIDKARHAGHGTSVNKLLWTSFNDQLVSASDDRTMSVWDLDFYPAHT